MGEEQQIPSTSSGQVAELTDQVTWTEEESVNPAHQCSFTASSRRHRGSCALCGKRDSGWGRQPSSCRIRPGELQAAPPSPEPPSYAGVTITPLPLT